MILPYKDIAKIKELNLPEILKSYGIPEGNRNNGTYSFKCPFHNDQNPSLKVNQKGNKWLWHCFGCGAGGTTLSFVMKYEKTSILGAYRKLIKCVDTQKFQIDHNKQNPNTENQTPSTEVLSPENEFNPADLLKRVTDFYHDTFKEDRRALEYLAKRKIIDQDIYLNFKLGFANGTLKKTLPSEGPMIEALKSVGILNAKGNETFYNCVIFPIHDEDGNVLSLYGRNIEKNSFATKPGGLTHLYLAGTHKGVFNSKVLAGTDRIFLTESIIDALSLYQLGIKETIALYGTNGLTKDHIELLQKHRIKEVILCLDNDEAGVRATEDITKRLNQLGVKTSKIKWPEGITPVRDNGSLIGNDSVSNGVKDPNDYLVSGKTKEEFIQLIEKIEDSIQNTEDRKSEEQQNFAISEDETQLTFNFSDRTYRIRGLTWNRLDQLRVNIKLKHNDNYHLDTLDLYSSRHRQTFISQARKVLHIDIADLNTDLNFIVEQLEDIQAKKLQEKNTKTDQKKTMTEQEKFQAEEFLKSPDLIEEIIADFKTCGYVGEESNVLLGYLAAISRKLSFPLAILIVSRGPLLANPLCKTRY